MENNIKEQNMTVKEKKLKTPAQKKRIRKIVIWSVIAVLVAVIVFGMTKAANAPMSVNVSKPQRGSICQKVNTGGDVVSLEKKTYFAPITGVLSEVRVNVGDAVKAGDILFTYDENEIAKAREQIDYKKKISDGNYNNSLQSNGRIYSNLNESLTKLPIYEEQVAFAENYIKELEKRIEDKKSALSKEGMQLQISLIDWADEPMSEEYENLQKLVQQNQYEQVHNEDLVALQNELSEANKILSDIKNKQSEMKSVKSANKDAVMTKGAKEELVATHESTILELDEQLADFDSVNGGITAEFDGVVTEVSAVEGGSVQEGTSLLKLESTEKCVVKVQLSKYDLESVVLGQKAELTMNSNTYSGTVSHINKVAELSQSGATVVSAQISIDNPDENIILGLEAKASILIGQDEDALLISNGYINYDTEGAFVYVVDNDTVSKKRIELGYVDDVNSQVISGLEGNESIITEGYDNLEEGQNVLAVDISENAENMVEK